MVCECLILSGLARTRVIASAAKLASEWTAPFRYHWAREESESALRGFLERPRSSKPSVSIVLIEPRALCNCTARRKIFV